jgi:hypothetical protein
MQLFELGSIYLDSPSNPPQYKPSRSKDEFGEKGRFYFAIANNYIIHLSVYLNT